MLYLFIHISFVSSINFTDGYLGDGMLACSVRFQQILLLLLPQLIVLWGTQSIRVHRSTRALDNWTDITTSLNSRHVFDIYILHLQWLSFVIAFLYFCGTRLTRGANVVSFIVFYSVVSVLLVLQFTLFTAADTVLFILKTGTVRLLQFLTFFILGI